MILHHLGPEKYQKSYPERHEFWKCHNSSLPWARESPNPTVKDKNFRKTALIDPSKNANKIRKVFIFPEFRTLFEMHSLTPSTLTKQPLWEHLVARFFNCRPIVIHSDSSTLAQDTILNCYKRPAHYHYQFSYFFRKANLILCSILVQIRSGCLWTSPLWTKTPTRLDKIPIKANLIC